MNRRESNLVLSAYQPNVLPTPSDAKGSVTMSKYQCLEVNVNFVRGWYSVRLVNWNRSEKGFVDGLREQESILTNKEVLEVDIG